MSQVATYLYCGAHLIRLCLIDWTSSYFPLPLLFSSSLARPRPTTISGRPTYLVVRPPTPLYEHGLLLPLRPSLLPTLQATSISPFHHLTILAEIHHHHHSAPFHSSTPVDLHNPPRSTIPPISTQFQRSDREISIVFYLRGYLRLSHRLPAFDSKGRFGLSSTLGVRICN